MHTFCAKFKSQAHRQRNGRRELPFREVIYDREKLYEKVWTDPIITVACPMSHSLILQPCGYAVTRQGCSSAFSMKEKYA